MKFAASTLLALAFAGLSSAAAIPQELAQRAGGSSIADVAEVGAKIAEIILQGQAADNDVRERFSQNMVDGFRREYGDNSNIVVIHTGHDYAWDGAQGTDWNHWHYELDIQIGGTVGYEMYVSKTSGYLKRTGDGGTINWAWYGFLTEGGAQEDGSRLNFIDPDA
ncbi:hypothetical protein OC835_003361 [Tilletia horrida]|nr:hypothetical protein OC835_003361 [Tilletia horrida]